MTSEKTARFALIVCLALSLVLYHGLQLLLPDFAPTEWTDLAKIAQMTVTAVLFIFLLYWQPVVKLMLRDKYIAGRYVGTSRHVDPKPGDERVKDEEFVIEQNLFTATITGRSTVDGKLQSSWVGHLYRVQGYKFWFAVELTFKQAEVGILDFTIQAGTADGFYKCADPGYPYAFAISGKLSAA